MLVNLPPWSRKLCKSILHLKHVAKCFRAGPVFFMWGPLVLCGASVVSAGPFVYVFVALTHWI